jgi:hypothetical protein
MRLLTFHAGQLRALALIIADHATLYHVGQSRALALIMRANHAPSYSILKPFTRHTVYNAPHTLHFHKSSS